MTDKIQIGEYTVDREIVRDVLNFCHNPGLNWKDSHEWEWAPSAVSDIEPINDECYFCSTALFLVERGLGYTLRIKVDLRLDYDCCEDEECLYCEGLPEYFLYEADYNTAIACCEKTMNSLRASHGTFYTRMNLDKVVETETGAAAWICIDFYTLLEN